MQHARPLSRQTLPQDLAFAPRSPRPALSWPSMCGAMAASQPDALWQSPKMRGFERGTSPSLAIGNAKHTLNRSHVVISTTSGPERTVFKPGGSRGGCTASWVRTRLGVLSAAERMAVPTREASPWRARTLRSFRNGHIDEGGRHAECRFGARECPFPHDRSRASFCRDPKPHGVRGHPSLVVLCALCS